MPFDQTITRLNSGVTLDVVHSRLWQTVKDLGIVDQAMVLMVLDDEVLPTEHPPADRFITVRLPSLIWAHGDVFIGGGDVGEFILQGQTRITLWLRNELDVYGQINVAMGEAAAAAPRGTRLIGQLIKGLHETDVRDEADGDGILKRPLKFISYDPPSPGAEPWRPFRLIFELTFTWSLAEGG